MARIAFNYLTQKVGRFFVLVEDGAGPLCLVLLMLTLAAQILGRLAGLGAQVSWTDEVARALFVWTVFLSLPLAAKRGALVAIKLSEKVWPRRLRPLLSRLAALTWLLTCLAAALATALNIAGHWDFPQLTPIMGLNQNYLHLVMPFSFLMVFFRGLREALSSRR